MRTVHTAVPGRARPGLPISSWAAMIAAFEESMSVERPDQFRQWLGGRLAEVLPHRHFHCALGPIESRGLRERFVATDAALQRYLASHRPESGELATPAFRRWLAAGSVVTEADLDPRDLQRLHAEGVDRLVAFGVIDRTGGLSSYCELTEVPTVSAGEASYVAQLLSPYVHAALARVASALHATAGQAAGAAAPVVAARSAGGVPPGAPARGSEGVGPGDRRSQAALGPLPPPEPAAGFLTPREKEVLRWISEGKSVWETARILGRSEHTIKNQVRRIYSKLGIHTRVQAARIADRLLGLQPGR